MNPRMLPNKLFDFDTEFHKTYKSPDYKIQSMLKNVYSMDKAVLVG